MEQDRTEAFKAQLDAALATMSHIEGAVLLSSIQLVLQAKSKSWATRRVNEYKRWLDAHRAEQAAQ